MNELSIIHTNCDFQYDWSLIEDSAKRMIVKTEVEDYQRKFETNRALADQIITQDTIAKAQCVSRIKQELNHGQFLDVCRESLNMNKNTAAAYVSIAKNIAAGADNDDILAMVRNMEPRAAQKLIKASESEQEHYINTYKETGRVPSQRTFRDRQEQQKRMDYNSTCAIKNEWSGSEYAVSNLNPMGSDAIPVVSTVIEEPAEVTEAPVEVMSSTDAPDRSELFTVATAAYDITKQLKALRMSLLTEHSREARSYAYSAFQDLEEEIGKCMQMSVSAQETLNRQNTTTL